MRRAALAAAVLMGLADPVFAASLIEPHMHIVPRENAPQVALTLDACMGATDMRILNALVANEIPATIFATTRWIKRNPDAVKLLVAHPDLFEIEDHGAQHVPAVIGTERPYGIAPAGTAAAVTAEVTGGAQTVKAATGIKPRWFRGATALYTPDALALIESLGFQVGAFSLNGDLGASASAKAAAARIEGAKSGDVIIAHVNQPTRPAGEGVVEGVLALKAKGFEFVRLGDATVVAEAH
jgi:peptidoglycan/xylan/chitin deacetylase (PgdA/CDA1 family)